MPTPKNEQPDDTLARQVPREPTEKMMLAGNNASPLYDREIRRIWRAMYDAAPAAEPVDGSDLDRACANAMARVEAIKARRQAAQQPPPPDTPHEVLAIIERKVGREMEATAARIAAQQPPPTTGREK